MLQGESEREEWQEEEEDDEKRKSCIHKKNLYKKPMATPLATLFLTPTKSKSGRPNEDPTMPCNGFMMQSCIT